MLCLFGGLWLLFFSYPVFFCNVLHSFISLVDVSSVLFLEALMKCLTLSSSALQFSFTWICCLTSEFFRWSTPYQSYTYMWSSPHFALSFSGIRRRFSFFHWSFVTPYIPSTQYPTSLYLWEFDTFVFATVVWWKKLVSSFWYRLSSMEGTRQSFREARTYVTCWEESR